MLSLSSGLLGLDLDVRRLAVRFLPYLSFMLVGKQATQELLDVNNKQVEHKGRIFYIINIHPCGALSSVSDLASPSVEAEV